MPTSLAHPPTSSRLQDLHKADVMVACPDARPPAYQAAVGLARVGRLDRFATSYYHRGPTVLTRLAEQAAPKVAQALRGKLMRRHDPAIPPERVRSFPAFDVALALEGRSGPSAKSMLARWRTRRFDQAVAQQVRQQSPQAMLAFSDVASEFALPLCRQRGIATILSMVHGEVHEENEVLAREQERSPEFFEIYLGDGPIDRAELDWLHNRRLRDLESADRILVPSEHIRGRLIANGTPAQKIDVIPYAADTKRFIPKVDKRHGQTCRFIFAGGITQRKGIKDLLDAWRLIRRPGWTLALLGAMPRNTRPLEPYRDEFEWLGRVGHAEMPRVLSEADAFVFPSLFEGSAVVTYEALACGLPSIVTAESGSVARDNLDGLIVPVADPAALAEAMERIGSDPDWRAEMAQSARRHAESFDWPRYHASLLDSIDEAIRGRV